MKQDKSGRRAARVCRVVAVHEEKLLKAAGCRRALEGKSSLWALEEAGQFATRQKTTGLLEQSLRESMACEGTQQGQKEVHVNPL